MNEFRSWKSYRDFADRVRRKTRYIRTPEDEEFLREVLRTSRAGSWTCPPVPGCGELSSAMIGSPTARVTAISPILPARIFRRE